MSIRENIENIRGRIAAAAQRSGRNASDITLVARHQDGRTRADSGSDRLRNPGGRRKQSAGTGGQIPGNQGPVFRPFYRPSADEQGENRYR